MTPPGVHQGDCWISTDVQRVADAVSSSNVPCMQPLYLAHIEAVKASVSKATHVCSDTRMLYILEGLSFPGGILQIGFGAKDLRACSEGDRARFVEGVVYSCEVAQRRGMPPPRLANVQRLKVGWGRNELGQAILVGVPIKG